VQNFGITIAVAFLASDCGDLRDHNCCCLFSYSLWRLSGITIAVAFLDSDCGDLRDHKSAVASLDSDCGDLRERHRPLWPHHRCPPHLQGQDGRQVLDMK